MGWSDLWHWIPWILERLVAFLTSEERTLVGSWFVVSTTGDYLGEWTFRPDRTVTLNACSIEGGSSWTHQEDTGKWEISKDRVKIEWSHTQPNSAEHCWDDLRRPMQASGVRGDSWNKTHRWRARKITGL
jgi:hypothetical protein